jgi:RnfABCDGE-type electron transport complex B subunit
MDPGHLDDVLPQWQCQQCGYPGCRPYAEALVRGETTIDRCRPGGTATFLALADRLGLDPAGFTPPVPDSPKRARIDPRYCIGCTRCLPACPVDAITGARHFLHEVLFSECTGCGLCVAFCPTDCIHLVELPENPTPQSPDGPRPDLDVGLERHRAAWLKYRHERHRVRFGPPPPADPESGSREVLLSEIRMMVAERRARHAARHQEKPRDPKS